MCSKRVELLAPAGNMDAFVAAVENGADAVYVGLKEFSARQYAANFDIHELENAVNYGHVRGVKVYLTINTLISDRELEQALKLTEQAYNIGIDALIVQDIGFASIIKKCFKGLDIHASTQMTVHNLDGVKLMEKLGFKRVILSRELSLEEISEITANSGIEIEIFVHGALCVCYSGQCLMSSIIGGRSGNRGKCAQPCRLPYKLSGSGMILPGDNEASYLLSPKDLCGLDILEDIVATGVRSLKIEGRMKSPEYVAITVGIYRKYLDRIVTNSQGNENCQVNKNAKKKENLSLDISKDMKTLAQVFNRGGFSKGYFFGKTGKDMICWEKPKNWGLPLGEVISYDKKDKMIKIKLKDNISVGDGIEVWTDGTKEESPGTIVSEIVLGGKNVKEAGAGEIVHIGRIKGKINGGEKVYKTSDKKLIDAARESYTRGYKKKLTVIGTVILRKGEAACLSVKDEDGNEVEVKSNAAPEEAINRPMTVDKVKEQVNKTGNTPFEFRELHVIADNSIIFPVKELNMLRRQALEELERKRIGKYKREPKSDGTLYKNCFMGNYSVEFQARLRDKKQSPQYPGISVLFYKYELQDRHKLPDALCQADRIYLPFNFFILNLSQKNVLENHIAALKEKGCEVYVWLSPVTRGNYDMLIKAKMPDVLQLGIDGVMVGNTGSIKYLTELLRDREKFRKVKITGDYSLNVFNSVSAKEYHKMGLDGITLSYELTLKQVEAICTMTGSEVEKEVVVYGRIPLMTSEYCVVGAFAGGASAKANTRCLEPCSRGTYEIVDRIGARFPVYCDKIDCRNVILNSKVLYMADCLEEVVDTGIDYMRLNIWDEGHEEINRLVQLHRQLISQDISVENFTRGHFFRGV